MSRSDRRRAEQKKEQGRIFGGFGAVAMALVPFIVRRLPAWIIAALVIIWLASSRELNAAFRTGPGSWPT